MKHSGRTIGLILVAGLLVMVAGWLLPPFFSAERYRRGLKVELERQLGRPVKFGAVSFRLVPRPGFSIENVEIGEAPEFGDEPFARIDRVECDIRWQTFWQNRPAINRLALERPSLNLVRDPAGVWNIRGLLVRSSPPGAGAAVGPVARAEPLTLEADDARVDFKIGQVKKPFAMTNVQARLVIDRSRGSVAFRLAGEPVRTDLSLPSPGRVELAGNWEAGENLSGPLEATLRTENALLYDWIPLLSGGNPGLHGVLDAQAELRGSIYSIQFEGRGRLRQFRRWELLPPTDPMPAAIYARGQFDRASGRVVVESADVSFAGSRLHASGNLEQVFNSPRMDMVVAVEHSRLEDFVSLARRFAGGTGSVGLTGRVDGLITLQGPWRKPNLGGFLRAEGARLVAGEAAYPVSKVDVRLAARGAHLAPVRVELGPRAELTVEGDLLPEPLTERPRRAPLQPTVAMRNRFNYDWAISVKAVPVRDLVRFGRAVGFRPARDFDAQGTATATFHAIGQVWPPERPAWSGQAELRGVQVFLPGLTEPLNLPHARLAINGNRIVADPVTAVIGTSVFTGRLEHDGDWRGPWVFDARTANLSLEQSALWFDVLGHRPPLPLLARIPGLRSLIEQRAAASNLFGGLNAHGLFSAGTVTYRAVTLKDLHASAAIFGRTVRIGVESFRAGAGRGGGEITVDLAAAPPRVVVNARLNGAALSALAPRFPPALQKVRGSYSAAGQFEMRGLTAGEISSSIRGQANVRLRDVSLGGFDALAELAQAEGKTWELPRTDTRLASATLTFRIQDRRVTLADSRLEMGSTPLRVSGSYQFNGSADLLVVADWRRVGPATPSRATSRGAREAGAEADNGSAPRQTLVHLSGPLDRLTLARPEQALRTAP